MTPLHIILSLSRMTLARRRGIRAVYTRVPRGLGVVLRPRAARAGGTLQDL